MVVTQRSHVLVLNLQNCSQYCCVYFIIKLDLNSLDVRIELHGYHLLFPVQL